MADTLNPELQDALREAGASEKASRAAARSTADASDMIKALIWIKTLAATVGVLFVVNLVALNQLFVLTAAVAENKTNIILLMEDVGELKGRVGGLEEGQREIINLLQKRLSKSADDDPAVAPEVSRVPQAPRSRRLGPEEVISSSQHSGNSHIDAAPEISAAPRVN